MSKKIGHINSDGSRRWPDLNIEGVEYIRPVSTFDLDKEHFVVLPVNFEAKYTAEDIFDMFPSYKPVDVDATAPVTVEGEPHPDVGVSPNADVQPVKKARGDGKS